MSLNETGELVNDVGFGSILGKGGIEEVFINDSVSLIDKSLFDVTIGDSLGSTRNSEFSRFALKWQSIKNTR